MTPSRSRLSAPGSSIEPAAWKGPMMGSQGLDPPTVAAGLLDDERMLKALAGRDMGTLFTLLNTRGVSTRKLAAAVDVSQGRLYDYMNGNCRVEKLSVFEQIADGLRIPGHLLGLARRPWEPAPEPSPPAISDLPADTGDLEAIDAFRDADRRSGGGRLYAAVTRHLTDQIAPRLVDAAGSPGVFAAAAALTEMAGWMAHDSAHDDLAVKHLTRALPLARVSGDAPLAANIAASTSHLTLHTNDRPGAARWARTGLHLAAQGPRIPALTARLHTMTARALAAAAQHSPPGAPSTRPKRPSRNPRTPYTPGSVRSTRPRWPANLRWSLKTSATTTRRSARPSMPSPCARPAVPAPWP